MVSYFDFCYTQGFPLRDDCIPAYRTFSIGHGDTIIRTTGGFSISTGYDRVLPRERIAACFGYIATTYGCDVLHGLQLRRVLHAGGTPYEEPSAEQQEEARVGLEIVVGTPKQNIL